VEVGRLSREQIPFNEYRWGQVLLSLPFVLLLRFVYFLMSFVTTEAEAEFKAPLPSNAMVIIFHTEFPSFPLTPRFWKTHVPGLAWVGIHNFISYAASLFIYDWGYRAIRFDPRSKTRPMDKVREYLKEDVKEIFGLRTDSGGPYEIVRHSAVTMALTSGRPVVAIRQRPSRYFTFNSHLIPLPGATIHTYVSAPVPAERLAALDIEEARQLLQTTIDSLLLP